MPAQLAQLPRYREFSIELAAAVLAEADRFASGVLAPVNQQGDRVGATWTPTRVSPRPPGFRAAYQQYVADGWPQLGIDAERGGQGAPQALVSAVEEIWYGANVALDAVPDALARGDRGAAAGRITGSCRQIYLPKMITGHWAGTMDAHRAAGRLGPGRDSHARAARRAITTWSRDRRSSSPTAITI